MKIKTSDQKCFLHQKNSNSGNNGIYMLIVLIKKIIQDDMYTEISFQQVEQFNR